MKVLILCVAVLGAVNADTSAWTQIRVKFSFSGALNNIANFWKIGNNLTAAKADGWIEVTNANDLNLTTACLSQIDVRFCALYDGNGYIAGMQLAIPKTDVEFVGYPQDFRNISVFEKKTISAVEYWTSTILVVNPTTLAAGGRATFVNLGDGFWIKNRTVYSEVPTTESMIPTSTLFNKQNCIPSMGTHYYYNIYNSTRCEDFEPIFVMTKHGNINGFGWQMFGRTTPPGRNWYDAVGRQAAELAVPLANKCLGDWTDLYGAISMHMYFVEEPWASTCDQATESAVPITGLLKIGLDGIIIFTNIVDTIRLLLHLY